MFEFYEWTGIHWSHVKHFRKVGNDCYGIGRYLHKTLSISGVVICQSEILDGPLGVDGLLGKILNTAGTVRIQNELGRSGKTRALNSPINRNEHRTPNERNAMRRAVPRAARRRASRAKQRCTCGRALGLASGSTPPVYSHASHSTL